MEEDRLGTEFKLCSSGISLHNMTGRKLKNCKKHATIGICMLLFGGNVSRILNNQTCFKERSCIHGCKIAGPGTLE